MFNTVVIDGECKLIIPETAETSLLTALDGECGVVTQVKAADYYEGATEVTPSEVTQTLPTLGLLLSADITINPIPSNYGLITWDGHTITVS